MREKYESLSLSVLKDLAKARGLKGVSALRGSEGIPIGKYRREEYRREGDRGQEACTRNADREKSGIKEYSGEGSGRW